MSWVLQHSEETLGRRLVLLCLADRANDDGTDAWPSVETLARDARMSRRQVQRSLRDLETSGAITQSGTSRKGTHIYSVNMTPPRGDIHDAAGATFAPEGGDILPPEPSLVQPPIEPSEGLAPLAREYDPLKGEKIDGRNLPWDELVRVTNADERLEKGKIARALKVIRAVVVADHHARTFVDPAHGEAFIAREIRSRGAHYRRRWPTIELTPTALAANWSRVVTDQPGQDLAGTLDAAQRGIDAARRTA
jgi:hypothetical protein